MRDKMTKQIEDVQRVTLVRACAFTRGRL